MVGIMTRLVFQALDLDRTLFDTHALELKLQEVARQFDPELADELRQESERYTSRGASFPIFRYLRQRLGERFPAYVTLLKSRVTPDELLCDGAKDRLAFAGSQAGWSGGIITYGDPDGQRLKLELCGLERYPHLITDTVEKGSVFTSWIQPDGTYRLPDELGGHTVDILTLDDDKLAAFNEYPDTAYGVWITPDPDAEKNIPTELSNRVVSAPSLKQSIERLKNLLPSA